MRAFFNRTFHDDPLTLLDRVRGDLRELGVLAERLDLGDAPGVGDVASLEGPLARSAPQPDEDLLAELVIALARFEAHLSDDGHPYAHRCHVALVRVRHRVSALAVRAAVLSDGRGRRRERARRPPQHRRA